jgi:hypothetical protein
MSILPNIRLIVAGYEIYQLPEGDFVISRDGKVFAATPTQELAITWANEANAKERSDA